VTEFLAMGGYAAYVWSAFSIAFLLMGGLFLQSRDAARRREADLEELRTRVRPQRRQAARPLRPQRVVEVAEPGLEEGT